MSVFQLQRLHCRRCAKHLCFMENQSLLDWLSLWALFVAPRHTFAGVAAKNIYREVRFSDIDNRPHEKARHATHLTIKAPRRGTLFSPDPGFSSNPSANTRTSSALEAWACRSAKCTDPQIYMKPQQNNILRGIHSGFRLSLRVRTKLRRRLCMSARRPSPQGNALKPGH